jgi:prophage regulatory protein
MFNPAYGGINMVTSILRLPAVKQRTGLSRSTIYLRVNDGTFPKPIHLGERAIGWVETDIEQWLEARIKTSRSAGR